DLMNLPGAARRDKPNEKPDDKAALPYDVAVVGKPAPPKHAGAPKIGNGIDPKKLPGIVIDDAQAKLTGKWTAGTGLAGFIGSNYHYTDGTAGQDTARFEFTVPTTGKYEVRFAYGAHENRADNVPVTITSAEGDRVVSVNEKKQPPLEHGFISLGTFQFEAGKKAAVVVADDGTDGHVAVDAVQVLPVK
ncbi:MAG TPA: hypothetical protein VLJ39_09450, partial [Tepidisphaeraceae bacterium]|nr:hypothetical protein [Tepidisphaeraceae bacterium]